MVGTTDEHDDVMEGAEDDVGSDTHENGNAEGRASTDAGNKFQQAVAAWRSLDLTKLVSNLDTTASEMVDQQKDSLVQRKELAQKTKDFRKMDDSGKLSEIKDLLKAYQGYIDVLTNQSKAVSAAFMQAYSPLSEAPDPYPLLEASIDSLVTADEVVPKLESENERLHKQVSKLNEQLEETETELEQERTKRQSFEGSQDSRIKEVEESWSAVLKEKEDNWTSKERSLEEKVESQDRLLKELKASYEVSQRLEKSGEDTQDVGRNTASAAELEIVNSELERTNMRLAEVEARNEQLRLELAQSTSQSNSSARSTAVEDDPAFLRLRSENSSLLRRLDSARHDKDKEKIELQSKLRGVERDISSLKADRDALQAKVQKWSDYDEVKRELEMLRAIEFASVEDEDAQTDDASHANGSAGKESLEQLLVARNKKLSNELTELRVSHQELQRRLEQLQEDLSSTNMDLEKARNLNATLENDLQKTQQEASNAFETMSVAGTYTSRYPKSQYGSRRGGGASPTSSIIGGFDPSSSGPGTPRATLESLRAGEPVGGGSGILPMVTAQRDRFKKKIGELEQELQKQYQTVSSLRSEIASLQKDNLNLYEKTRYVSTYNRGQPTSSGAAYGSNPNPSTVQVGSADTPSGLSLDRYRSAYEQNISPFAAFRGRESARALKRMSLPERAVFQITRMVLATRTSRNLFALYCLALHLLVFFMLYWMGSVDIEKHASNLSASVAGSGAAAAAANAAGGGAADHGDWQQEGFKADSS
ncbi:hypothetical protein PRZ48_003775 [Zasmidium cellare]|uniref:Protein CASP n=1 Tax=Zasmidium cellare TaxID=395010 RepID=A0ABR0EX32_ZASCE|nr:hypothetical protein PRZ48_003775 [Zasmidium cellare]